VIFIRLRKPSKVLFLRSLAYRGGRGLKHPPPPRNSEVLTNLSKIPSSVKNTTVTT
jgi:hypothetical protein